MKNHFYLTSIIAIAASAFLSTSFATKSLDHVIAGGFGGNEKVGKFSYDGRKLPLHFSKLEILRDSEQQICYLQNANVTVRIIRSSDDNPIVEFPCAEQDPKYQIYWNSTLQASNGAYSPANDAMYSGDVVNSMYKDWYNIPVLKIADTYPPQQMPLILRIHDWGGANAYWDGQNANFGDGDEDHFYPFATLTIIAHEISHGFTQQHSNLQYTAQSGGLNESFSDMASKAAEFYSTGRNNDWQLGNEVMKADRAYRYMDNPRRDCIYSSTKKICSIDNLKNYSSDINVHYSSGIFNKAFYLLATSLNWDTHKAFNIMVQANMGYWTQTTTFIEAACGVMEAAKDYGYDTETVMNAFMNVGIDTNQCQNPTRET